MNAIFRRRWLLPAGLLTITALPVIVAALRLVQIPTGSLPDDVAYFTATPIAHFGHAAAGIAFCLLGPLQFVRPIRARFPAVHRLSGRIFAVAGLALALSGLRMVAAFPHSATWLLDGTRIAASLALAVSLFLAIRAIRRGHVAQHRAMMIRSYALGMGGTTVALPAIPALLITGAPLDGLAGDAVFLSCWLVSLGLAEWAIARGSAGRQSAMLPAQ